MPGSITRVIVEPGQAVNTGDLLLTMEAMKMEAGIHTEHDATVKAIHAPVGSQVDAKDLLLEFET